MTDVVAVKGRSLWIDAWNRLKANRAATISAVYLCFIVLLTIIGPSFTGHEFTTQYPSYVRVPPSLEPYPKADKLDQEIKEVITRAHLTLKEWKEFSVSYLFLFLKALALPTIIHCVQAH